MDGRAAKGILSMADREPRIEVKASHLTFLMVIPESMRRPTIREITVRVVENWKASVDLNSGRGEKGTSKKKREKPINSQPENLTETLLKENTGDHVLTCDTFDPKGV